MSSIAVKSRGLSKQYRLGETEPYKTLREAIVRLARAPMRLKGNGNGKRDTERHVWALRDVSFDLHEGEVLGIIGRNGAGKSTLLKVLSRITEPTEGFAEIHGRVGSLLEVGTGFHPELTGRENVYMNGAILGMRKREIDHKFDEIVAFAEVEQFLDTPVKRYSSGMQTRLAFAVAAHLEPDILIVDEVLAVGDAKFQSKCMGKMNEVARGGRTVLFVSHNMNAIQQLCTRGIVVDNGRLTFDGTADDAAGHYLDAMASHDFGSADLTNHPGRKRNSIPLLTSVRVHRANDMDQPAITINSGDDVAFHVGYDCGAQRYDWIKVCVETLLGERICSAGTHTTADCPEVFTGRGVAECRIPDLRLAPGEYSVRVVMGQKLGPSWVDVVDDAMRFHVELGDFFNVATWYDRSQGMFVQRCNWRIIDAD
ncbi:MAG: ABC transporter ATP-binding protein [Planctomycetaceae bacterium]|nr:ABC transporter ATP-binding protein [Planctomycetaceae bacterium]